MDHQLWKASYSCRIGLASNLAATASTAGYVAYANVALTNRDGGLVRNSDGTNPAPSFAIQNLALTTPDKDTMTAQKTSVLDDGAAGDGNDIGNLTTKIGCVEIERAAVDRDGART